MDDLLLENFHFSSYGFGSLVCFVGTREALLDRGLITPRTVLPKAPRGRVNVNPEPGDPEGYGGMITMLFDRRLRVTLNGNVAAWRDRHFRVFMKYVLQRPRRHKGKAAPDGGAHHG